jgi:hypothetical protein
VRSKGESSGCVLNATDKASVRPVIQYGFRGKC